jgi:hypothetical protein
MVDAKQTTTNLEKEWQKGGYETQGTKWEVG